MGIDRLTRLEYIRVYNEVFGRCGNSVNTDFEKEFKKMVNNGETFLKAEDYYKMVSFKYFISEAQTFGCYRDIFQKGANNINKDDLLHECGINNECRKNFKDSDIMLTIRNAIFHHGLMNQNMYYDDNDELHMNITYPQKKATKGPNTGKMVPFSVDITGDDINKMCITYVTQSNYYVHSDSSFVNKSNFSIPIKNIKSNFKDIIDNYRYSFFITVAISKKNKKDLNPETAEKRVLIQRKLSNIQKNCLSHAMRMYFSIMEQQLNTKSIRDFIFKDPPVKKEDALNSANKINSKIKTLDHLSGPLIINDKNERAYKKFESLSGNDYLELIASMIDPKEKLNNFSLPKKVYGNTFINIMEKMFEAEFSKVIPMGIEKTDIYGASSMIANGLKKYQSNFFNVLTSVVAETNEIFDSFKQTFEVVRTRRVLINYLRDLDYNDRANESIFYRVFFDNFLDDSTVVIGGKEYPVSRIRNSFSHGKWFYNDVGKKWELYDGPKEKVDDYCFNWHKSISDKALKDFVNGYYNELMKNNQIELSQPVL